MTLKLRGRLSGTEIFASDGSYLEFLSRSGSFAAAPCVITFEDMKELNDEIQKMTKLVEADRDN